MHKGIYVIQTTGSHVHFYIYIKLEVNGRKHRIYRHLYKEWKAWIHGEAREFSEQTCAFMDEERKQSRSLHKHVYRGKGVAVGIGSELMTPFKVVWMPSSRP